MISQHCHLSGPAGAELQLMLGTKEAWGQGETAKYAEP
jgi:hypothetical protein